MFSSIEYPLWVYLGLRLIPSSRTVSPQPYCVIGFQSRTTLGFHPRNEGLSTSNKCLLTAVGAHDAKWVELGHCDVLSDSSSGWL